MNNEEKRQKVEAETKRVVSQIDEMLGTTRIFVKDEVFFDREIYPMISDMCLKGVVEAYNYTMKNSFQSGTRRQKKECLELYRKIFSAVFS